MMPVVTWHTAAADEAVGLDDAWREVFTRTLLPVGSGRIVVHIAPTVARELVLDTAGSLVNFLQRSGASRIEIVIDRDAPAWPGVVPFDLGAQPRYRVDVACLRDGALIPAPWFEDLTVVTVADYAPDRRLGIRGILAAQAQLLGDSAALDLDVMFAAHRLMRSNLCVGCGTATFGDPRSSRWWAISPDDVALERAVAWQAGAEPDALPVFRHLARHESRPPEDLGTSKDVPRLVGHVAPAGQVAVARLEATMLERGRRIRQDVRLGLDNLGRLPQFVQRRVPAIARLWRTA